MRCRFSAFLAGLVIAWIGYAGDAAIVRGPVVDPRDPGDGGPPSAVRIWWRTDAATTTNIARAAETPEGPWSFTGTDPAGGTDHLVLIEGLDPDAVYWLQVESDGTVSDPRRFRTGRNLLVNGSFEAWHPVSEPWGGAEPDGWNGWELFPWEPPGSTNPDHITIAMDRATGIPTPAVRDRDHRVGMDEGWRSCYGGVRQEIPGLGPGDYVLSGWVAYLFDGTDPAKHRVEILVRDGPHEEGSVPDGEAIFAADRGAEMHWVPVEETVACTSGTLTVYCDLRSDDWDGSSFAHFDGMWLMSAVSGPVGFSDFETDRVVNGSNYDLTIRYRTDIATTTRLEWGPTTAYGNLTPEDSSLVTEHEVSLTGVPPAAEPYHFRVLATAPPDIEAASADRTFDAPDVVPASVDSTVDPKSGTTSIIRWETNFATPWNRVHYRPVGSGSWIEVSALGDPEARTSHTATLTGLSLGTDYEYYVESSGPETLAGESAIFHFQTPLRPGRPWRIGMAMIGGSIADGGDDVGPANEVQDMIERDHPEVNVSHSLGTSWRAAQPEDPGEGPDVYDWTDLERDADRLIPGKALTSYYQIWGTGPDWVELDSPRYWEKFEDFVEAMVVHINERYGPVYFIFENEPNISRAPEGWNWADWYMHCLRHFYPALHRADAVTGMENKVIAGNLSGHAAGGFEDLYARGLKDFSDILGYHPYAYDMRDGLDVEDLARIHGIQERYGDGDKKIFVTEGWGSGRSAGFDRSSPLIPPSAQEIENMWLAMTRGWDNVMTPRENWSSDCLFGMRFFCGNDNWGAMNWRKRAIPQKDEHGNIVGFIVDGYWMTPDIAPYFWNGGMFDFYGNSKDCLTHVFPGDGLVFMNPGFELPSEPPSSHLPHFWTAADDPAPPDVYALDDAIFHGGSRSLRLAPAGGAAASVRQTTVKRAILPGESCTAGVWVRIAEGGAATARFGLRFCDRDGAPVSEMFETSASSAPDWRRLEVSATAPAGADRVEVFCTAEGSGIVRFDDVTVASGDAGDAGFVKGYTLDEEQVPVAGCIVRTTTGGFQALSDENGYYEMPGVDAGTYDFICRKPGYVPHRVGNQTVAAGRTTFVSFNMVIPRPGLEVAQVSCVPGAIVAEGPPATVTVTVANGSPYPNDVGAVELFVEDAGADATGLFRILPDPANPRRIEAGASATFVFSVTADAAATGRRFEINAYAFGQEDRPDMLRNGGFDAEPWDEYWSFTGGAPTLEWAVDTEDYVSPPRSLRCSVAGNDYTWNWANNYSAYEADAVPAHPGRNYTVGVRHRDRASGAVPINLFIQEYYYDGTNWFYNGRRFVGLPHRDVWAEDVMIYETGSPEVNPGLYPTSRLVISCGPGTTPEGGSGQTWWDDLYVKETGDWLADDRADSGAVLRVTDASSDGSYLAVE